MLLNNALKRASDGCYMTKFSPFRLTSTSLSPENPNPFRTAQKLLSIFIVLCIVVGFIISFFLSIQAILLF